MVGRNDGFELQTGTVLGSGTERRILGKEGLMETVHWLDHGVNGHVGMNACILNCIPFVSFF